MTNERNTIEFMDTTNPEFRERMSHFCGDVLEFLQQRGATPGEAYYVLKVLQRYMEDKFAIELTTARVQTEKKQ